VRSELPSAGQRPPAGAPPQLLDLLRQLAQPHRLQGAAFTRRQLIGRRGRGQPFRRIHAVQTRRAVDPFALGPPLRRFQQRPFLTPLARGRHPKGSHFGFGRLGQAVTVRFTRLEHQPSDDHQFARRGHHGHVVVFAPGQPAEKHPERAGVQGQVLGGLGQRPAGRAAPAAPAARCGGGSRRLGPALGGGRGDGLLLSFGPASPVASGFGRLLQQRVQLVLQLLDAFLQVGRLAQGRRRGRHDHRLGACIRLARAAVPFGP
jgi:hypothetical protein